MNPEFKLNSAIKNFVLALLITFIVGCSVDMFVPSLPYIATGLHTKASIAKLIVGVYLIFYAVSQLIAGSVTDSFGRRTTLLVSGLGYLLATLGAATSFNIELLLIARAAQGIFCAHLSVASRALITDSFQKDTIPRFASYVTFAWATGTIISPFIGGYLQEFFGWRGSFYALSGYVLLIMLLVLFLLRETSPHKHAFNLKTIGSNYKIVFSNKQMWGFALLCGFSYAFITIYNVIGPFLVEHVLNHSAVVYGRIALALGIAWLCGNMIFSRFAKKNKKEALIKITSISIFIVTLIFFICAIIFKLEFTLLVIIPVILFFLAGSFFPYGFGMCLSLFPKMGGTGSAAAGFLYCLIAGATSVLAAFLKAHNMIPLSVSYLILGTLLLVVFLIMQRKALKKN